MEEVIYQADLESAPVLLKNWLATQAPAEALTWLENKKKQILEDKPGALFFMTFSAIPNFFSKDILTLSKDELKRAATIRSHWQPRNWSLAQTARTYLLLSIAHGQVKFFKETIDKLLSAADIQELIAIYQAIPLFPYPEEFLLNATNGIRSNMQSVFDAIALNNPYPKDYFDEIAWNQLILKTLFVDSPIEQVIGIKSRANPALARALFNTARERFAANRPIKLELWGIAGLSTDKEILPLLEALLKDKSPILQKGGLLACNLCKLPEAKELLSKHPDRQMEIKEDLDKLRDFEKLLIE